MPVNARLRSILTNAGSFALAAALLWWVLRDVAFAEVETALAQADYRWLPALVVVLLASHAVRAWRWKLLLGALPEASGPARPPTFFETFAALMMGYAVNYVAPRVGEVVRTATIARRTGLPVSGVLGTVVVDRLLDVAMLAAGLLTVPLLLRERWTQAFALFVAPALARVPRGEVLAVGALGLAVLAGAGVLVWRRMRAARADGAGGEPGRLSAVVRGFGGGLRTIRTSPHGGALVGLTVLMWGLYGLLGYLPFLLLQTAEPYGLTLVDGWCIMLLGAIGLAVPTPGGAGSYHYVAIQTLTLLYAMARPDAVAYAVLSHASQLVLYVVCGALAVVALALVRRPAGDGERAPGESGAALTGGDVESNGSARRTDGSDARADRSARGASVG